MENHKTVSSIGNPFLVKHWATRCIGPLNHELCHSRRFKKNKEISKCDQNTTMQPDNQDSLSEESIILFDDINILYMPRISSTLSHKSLKNDFACELKCVWHEKLSKSSKCLLQCTYYFLCCQEVKKPYSRCLKMLAKLNQDCINIATRYKTSVTFQIFHHTSIPKKPSNYNLWLSLKSLKIVSAVFDHPKTNWMLS